MEKTNVKHSSMQSIPYKKWDESYELFVAYEKEFPYTPVVKSTEYHGFKLGIWVATQRRAKKKETLSPEKVKLLDEAGIIWDPLEEAWQQGYKSFIAYKKEFPDTPVPAKAEYHDFNLGQWVGIQRKVKNNKSLSVERINLLEEAGIVWAILRSATEVIAMFERGENVSTSKKGLPNSIRKYLCEKYNNSCAIGKVDLNNFSILPKSKQKLDGKNCQFTTDPLFTRKSTRMNGAPNLQIAHLDDNFSNNTITNLLPLCPNCHGSITYTPEQTRKHLRKANVAKSRYSLI